MSKHKYTKILLLCFLIVGCDKKSDKKETINSKIASSIQKEDWYAASKLLNLHLNMKSSASMHLANGFIYDKLAKQDPSYAGLSVIAYKRALNLDPNNWSASLAIGKYYMREHDYLKAISAFAKTLTSNENNFEALYGMANAAYATRNITLAKNCIDKAIDLRGDNKLVNRLAALIYAAQNNSRADKYANKYAFMEDDLYEIKYLRDRIQDWKKTHKKMRYNPNFMKSFDSPDTNQKDENITIECVILSFNESGAFSRGNNFLETLQEFKRDEFTKGLSIRMGNNSQVETGLASSPVYSNNQDKKYIFDNGKWILSPDLNDHSKLIKKGFSIGFDSIRYNLNILNSSSSIIDIISRPIMQVSSKNGKGAFDSNDKSFVNTGGDVGSALSNIPSGVKLEVEANQVDKDHIMLGVMLEISKTTFKNNIGSLNDNANVISAQLQTQIKAKLNETMVIGGVYSNVNESSKSGVPGAQNMPLLDLVLANKSTHTSKKSVMMLLTAKNTQESKVMEVDIDRMENVVLLKQSEPSFFKHKYNREKTIKQQVHAYRREDIKSLNISNNTIQSFAERI
ncbi:tetratricopeptide repeat protein [Candidatus Cytomitobacter primus]|nr:tetratricopeptide repeat protein [Candidatus Cytomitobacter primus]